MASAARIQLSTDVGDWPVYYRPGITAETAQKASECLQENHDKFDIFFHEDRLHNHTVHHLLAIWALGASPESLSKAYEGHASHQRTQPPADQTTVEELHDPAKFMSLVGGRFNYGLFLRFFQAEIEASSWQEVLQKYLFAEDDQVAETMLVRMYAGFLHPIIHLGYGIEFRQPAIVAEALAQAACHEAWIGNFLLPADKASKEKKSGEASTKSIVQLLDEIHDDDELREAAHWSDGNKIRDGILARAGPKMIDVAAQFTVRPEDLEKKTAEMTNAVCYYTAAAQHPAHMIMYDFYFMHCVNASIFFPAFLAQPWLSTQAKVRLLEYKVRMDLAMYASRRCPSIRLDEIRSYHSKQPSDGWDGLHDRVCRFYDDGHASKLIRALAHGQRICGPYEGQAEFRLKGEDWLRMGHMAMDSVEGTAGVEGLGRWVRSAGFEEAWEKIPLRAQL